MNKIEIACLPGDGVGIEVMASAKQVLQKAADMHGGVQFLMTDFPWGSYHYVETGAMMPKDGIERLKAFDAVFLGVVGK